MREEEENERQFPLLDGFKRFECHCGNYLDIKESLVDKLKIEFNGFDCNKCGKLVAYWGDKW